MHVSKRFAAKKDEDRALEGPHTLWQNRTPRGARRLQAQLDPWRLARQLRVPIFWEFSFIGMRNGWIDAAFFDIKPYCSTGSTHGHDPAYAKEIVRLRKSEGYRALKLRIKSTDIAEMARYVEAARQEAGTDMDLMVDCNQGWPVSIVEETPKWTEEFALQLANALQPFNLKWIEEPLNRGNIDGLARLRRSISTPIAGGELNNNYNELLQVLEKESLDIFQPDAVMAGGSYAGGISVVLWLIHAIRAHNASRGTAFKFCPHTWTTGLGFVVNLHMYGLVPPSDRGLVEYPLEGSWNAHCWAKFIKNGPTLFSPDKQGNLTLPTGPGLGIELDMDVVSKYGKRVYVGSRPTVTLSVIRSKGLHAAHELKEKKELYMERSGRSTFHIPRPPFGPELPTLPRFSCPEPATPVSKPVPGGTVTDLLSLLPDGSLCILLLGIVIGVLLGHL